MHLPHSGCFSCDQVLDIVVVLLAGYLGFVHQDQYLVGDGSGKFTFDIMGTLDVAIMCTTNYFSYCISVTTSSCKLVLY